MLMTMTETLSLAEVKAHLSELVGRVSSQHDRVTVTVHGRPSAVLLSPDVLDALEETIAVLSDTDTCRSAQRPAWHLPGDLPNRRNSPHGDRRCRRPSRRCLPNGLAGAIERRDVGGPSRVGGLTRLLLAEQPEERREPALGGVAEHAHRGGVVAHVLLGALLHSTWARPGLDLADPELSLDPTFHLGAAGQVAKRGPSVPEQFHVTDGRSPDRQPSVSRLGLVRGALSVVPSIV